MNGRIFVDGHGRRRSREGTVDGMECDEFGNVWVTGPGGVWVLTPAGERLGVIETPEVCGSLRWGGPDLRTLFLTTSTTVHTMPTLCTSAPLPHYDLGGTRRMTDADRLQVLEAREEIRQIFVDYAQYLDSGDHAGYASLFTADGVLVAQLGEAVGPAAIEAILDDNLGPQVRGHLPASIHVMTNETIDVVGDTATTSLVWYYLTTDADGCPTVLQSGRYEDDLVREDGSWKIKRHEISEPWGARP